MKKLNYLFVFVTIIISIGFTACQKTPETNFTMDKSSVYITESIAFTNTSTDGSTYKWDFGDGVISTEKNPTHIYTTPGIYTVKLTAFSENGKKSDDNTADVTILSNRFEYNNVQYDLPKGILMKYSQVGNVFKMGVFMYAGYSLTTSGIYLTKIFGTGDYAWFDIYTTDSTALAPGTFTYNTNNEVGTFTSSKFAINYTIGKKISEIHDIKGGTMTIQKKDSQYCIYFIGTDDNGKALKVTYSGELKFYIPYFIK